MTVEFPATRNIIITGFMGTGKTTIGRLVAARLERQFHDMDEQIEAHFGKPIPQVFAEDGEEAFRAVEADLCRRFAKEKGIVLSTGGGALVSPANRAVLAQSGILICLTATVDAILERVEQAQNRPLLPDDREERVRRVRELLYARRHAYAAIPHRVDTTMRYPKAIVNDVLATLEADMEAPGMTRIPVHEPAGAYDICLGEGLLSQTGRLLLNRGLRPGPAAIVTNPVLKAHYADELSDCLRRSGFAPAICVVPEGEQHKTLTTVSNIYDQLLAAGLDRRSPVIALGGGVVGDMAGFAAATYLRGVPFVQIPTSLLAMVDASVGGKTGVDLPQGKNLVGAFKQPHVVVIDVNALETLPASEFRSGLAEVIKHGIIGDPDLFVQLEDHGPANLAQLLADAVRVKVRIVEEDPYEQGRRALLNLGHTFGHAIELVSDFRVRHGEGVALGLVASSRLAANLNRCASGLADRIATVVDRLGLPTSIAGYDSDAIIAAMSHDKKRSGSTLRFIIPNDLGSVEIIDDPGCEFVQAAVDSILGR